MHRENPGLCIFATFISSKAKRFQYFIHGKIIMSGFFQSPPGQSNVLRADKNWGRVKSKYLFEIMEFRESLKIGGAKKCFLEGLWGAWHKKNERKFRMHPEDCIWSISRCQPPLVFSPPLVFLGVRFRAVQLEQGIPNCPVLLMNSSESSASNKEKAWAIQRKMRCCPFSTQRRGLKY